MVSDPVNPVLAIERICLDFRLREDLYWPRLVAFLDRFRRALDLEGTEDIAEAYLERVWPNNLPGALIVANISFDLHPRWLMRPPVEGPLAGSFAAGSRAPAFVAYRKQGRMVVCGFEVTPHISPRPFEALVSGMVYRDTPGQYMAPPGFAALEALPRHRQLTDQRLAPWREYLDWRERLLQIGQAVLAYDRRQLGQDGILRFHVRGMHSLPNLRKRLGRATLLVAPLSASQTPERWDPPAGVRPRLTKVGDVQAIESFNGRQAQTGKPSERSKKPDTDRGPVVIAVTRPTEEQDETAEGIPDQGFLLVHIGGDLKPLAHERTAVERLRNGHSFNLHLADYLFDIRNAAEPEFIPDVVAAHPDLAGMLNQVQQAAVNKADAAPDIFLIQGPPGTGKTHVIVAIIVLAIAKGYRVLVVSQTNLAVDNPLSRLPARPGIRPLRIAKTERVDREFQDLLEDKVVHRWLSGVRTHCQGRIQQTEAVDQAVRRAEESFSLLGRVVDRAAELTQSIQNLQDEFSGLQEQRESHQESSRSARQEAEQLERRCRAVGECAEWLDHPQTEPPSTELLAGTGLEESLAQAATRLSRALGRFRWQPGWLPTSVGTSAALILHLGQKAAAACAELEAPLSEALALCKGATNVDGSEQTRQLRQLQTEKLGLMDSDREEDIRRLAALNREIKNLRRGRWSDVCRSLARPLQVAFDGALPPELERLVSSLQPENAHVGVLRALGDFGERVRTAVSSVLTENASVLKEQAAVTIADLEARQQQQHREANEVGMRLSEIEARIEQAQEQLEEARFRLEENNHRWAEAWPDVCADLPAAETAPALSGEALQAREEAFRGWRAEHAPEQQHRRRWRAIQQEWVHRIANPSEADRQAVQAQYVRHANVVGMTCYEAGQKDFYDHPQFEPFDVVIIDETSKVTPPELLMPGLLGRKLIPVGDHRQLNPMFKENEAGFEDAVEEGLVRSEDFERHKAMVTAGFFGELFEAAPSSLKHTLNQQYRFHSQIMEVINPIYHGQLTAAPSVELLDQRRQHHLQIRDNRGGWLLEPHQHLLWIDSSVDARGRPFFEQQRGTSKANLLEAEMILAFLTKLNHALQQRGYGPGIKTTATGPDQGLTLQFWAQRTLKNAQPETVSDLLARNQIRLNGRAGQPDDRIHAGDALELDARKPVGVITFYGAQIQEIRNRIRQVQSQRPDAFAAMDLRTNTVDFFQGMERAIVLVSLVRARSFLRGGEHVSQYQRVNVAFSRAQELLVIIGAERTFRNVMVNLPSMDGGPAREVPLYRNTFELVKRFGGRRYVRQILD